jgi:hypothetical protein
VRFERPQASPNAERAGACADIEQRKRPGVLGVTPGLVEATVPSRVSQEQAITFGRKALALRLLGCLKVLAIEALAQHDLTPLKGSATWQTVE